MAEATLIRGDEPQNSLLVEGTDDEHMFYSLLVYHRIPKRLEDELAARLPCCGECAELLEQTQHIVVRVVADNHPVPDLEHLASLEPH